MVSAVADSGAPEQIEDVVRATILGGAAPFRRADGSYLFRNEFRWAIATR